MLYAVTHGYTKRAEIDSAGEMKYFSDPVHTHAGLLNQLFRPLCSRLISLQPTEAHVGRGTRFQETYEVFRSHLKTWISWRKYNSSILGTSDSQIDLNGQRFVVGASGQLFLPGKYCGIAYYVTPEEAWKYLLLIEKECEGNKLLFTGRQFLELIGVESTSASIYRINPVLKSVRCIVERGVFLDRIFVY